MDEEVNGLIFTDKGDIVQVQDLNYGIIVGSIRFDEGPGWIFIPSSKFLDLGHITAIRSWIINHITDREIERDEMVRKGDSL